VPTNSHAVLAWLGALRRSRFLFGCKACVNVCSSGIIPAAVSHTDPGLELFQALAVPVLQAGMCIPMKTSLQLQSIGHLPSGEHEALLTLLTCVVTSGWSNEMCSKGMGQNTALAIGRRSDRLDGNQNVIFISQIYKTRSMACPAAYAYRHNIEIRRQSFTVVTAAVKVFGEGSPARTHKLVCLCTKTGQRHKPV